MTSSAIHYAIIVIALASPLALINSVSASPYGINCGQPTPRSMADGNEDDDENSSAWSASRSGDKTCRMERYDNRRDYNSRTNRWER